VGPAVSNLRLTRSTASAMGNSRYTRNRTLGNCATKVGKRLIAFLFWWKTDSTSQENGKYMSTSQSRHLSHPDPESRPPSHALQLASGNDDWHRDSILLGLAKDSNGYHDVHRNALLMVDPQCPCNIIDYDLLVNVLGYGKELEETFGLQYSRFEKAETIFLTLHKASVEAIGKATIRWIGPEYWKCWDGQEINFPKKFISSEFMVVKDAPVNAIIGLPTIQDERLAALVGAPGLKFKTPKSSNGQGNADEHADQSQRISANALKKEEYLRSQKDQVSETPIAAESGSAGSNKITTV